MRLSIDHLTTYRYAEQASRSTQYIRLTPQNDVRQRILDWHLEMPSVARACRDGFGNLLHVLTLDRPHSEISIRAWGEVEIDAGGAPVRDTGLTPLIYLRYSRLTRPNAEIADFARRHGDTTLRGLERMMEALLEVMPYQPGATHVASTAAEAFAQSEGVCQDHTHVFLAAARFLGMPARYVSGYLYTDDAGHVSSHAWAEVWLDGEWLPWDVTNATRETGGHLCLAVGVDYLDACPIRGVRIGGGAESMDARALVARREEDLSSFTEE